MCLLAGLLVGDWAAEVASMTSGELNTEEVVGGGRKKTLVGGW